MKLTLEKATEMMRCHGGSLDLSGTSITALPKGLKAGDDLFTRGTGGEEDGL